MEGLSSYEKQRLQNIAENKKFLAELGFNPYKPLGKVIKKPCKRKRETTFVPVQKKRTIENVGKVEAEMGSVRGDRRRSLRVRGQTAQTQSEIAEEVKEWAEDDEPRKKVAPNRPNIYGFIEGVEVGTNWPTRMECCAAGIHRPTVAGIHGGQEGAYSIALSGGYEDNIDLGECFTYTGEGGRDLKGTKNNPKNLRTAPQSKDQTLTRGNLALYTSVQTGNPVRVIRGYKLDSPFSTEEGYRYDGLYKVEKAWNTIGASGFLVWKFALKRIKDQAPPPWDLIEEGDSPFDHKATGSEDVPDSQDSGIGSEVGSGRTSPSSEVDNTEVKKEPSEMNADCTVDESDQVVKKDQTDAENKTCTSVDVTDAKSKNDEPNSDEVVQKENSESNQEILSADEHKDTDEVKKE